MYFPAYEQELNFLLKLATMNKLILIPLAAISLIFQIQAQTYKYADPMGQEGFDLRSQSAHNIYLTYSIHEFTLDDLEIRGEAMKHIRLENHFLPGEEGSPNLPGSGRYIALPQGAKPILHIKSLKREIIKDVNISPSPRIPKDTERGPMEYHKNQKVYSNNAFYPAEPFTLSEPTKIRGVDAVILGITPFQYNPVTKELIVYRDIEVEVEFEGGNGQFGEERLWSRWWEPLLEDVFVNYNQITPSPGWGRAGMGAEGGLREGVGYEYLIICPDLPEFRSWADTLRLFRTMQGINTGVVTTAEIGGNNVTLIEDYINLAYNTWDIPPAAVLLLGDYGSGPDEITSPIWDNYCVSDHLYADVSDDDEEEIAFARMTARNAAELEVMVKKALDYETNPPTNPEFYNHPITALGWQTERWFQVCSEVVGGYFRNVHGKDPVRINAVYLGNPESDPWSTAENTESVMEEFGPDGLGYIPATPSELGAWTGGTSVEINNALNAGAFLIQHRDHGYEYGWGEPDYDNDDIDGLTNTDLSFFFSINCLTGKYNFGAECFAEKLHRYTFNGQPAGALGLIAASETSYSFVNDVYVWGVFDNMFPDFMPDYGTTPASRGVLPAFGNPAGKIFLKYSSWPFNIENKEVTYNLFHHHGDAFTCLYTEVPQELSVLHDPLQIAGSPTFTITADEGSLVALSVNGELIGVGTGTGLPEDIPIVAQNPPAMIDVIVTKQNYFRYHAKLQVIPPEGPYVIAETYVIDDNAGNNNDKLDYGETVILDMNFKNLGYELAENVTVTLSSTDEYVSIQDNTTEAGTIQAGETTFIEGAFAVTAHENVPNSHIIKFNIEATNGESTWYSTFTIKAQAPVLQYVSYIIDDAAGNNNGRLDPGETADLVVSFRNKGAADAFGIYGRLACSDPYIQLLTDSAGVVNVAYSDTATLAFSVSAIVITPPGHEAEFSVGFTGNSGISAGGDFLLFVGLFPILVLDLDGNNNSADKIMTAIGNWRVFAETSEEIPANLRQYQTIFLCLGTYSDNHVLTQTEAAPFLDFLNNGGKLYLEGGDTWYYDQLYNGTTLHPLFNIHGLNDGYDDLLAINGKAGTLAEGFSFFFSGENSYIDRIEPVEPAYTIMNNSSPEYEVAIANDAGTYRTIGSSFEFGGLLDNMGSTKKNLMKKYLTFFGMEPISAIPEIPEGDTLVCTDEPSSVYFTRPVEGALYYIWELNPPGSGTIDGWDSVVTINWTPGYIGNTTLRVSGMNQNGLGPVSTSLLIHHSEMPTAQLEYTDTEICAGDTTYANFDLTGENPWIIVLSLGGNEIMLFSNKTTMDGVPFAPTADIDVNIVSVTDASGCVTTGFDTISIHVLPLPSTPAKPAGYEYVGLLSGTETIYTTTGSDSASGYTWQLEPASAGNLIAGEDGLECTVHWITTFTGEATLKVKGINDCGESGFSDPLVITVANTYGVEENGSMEAWGHGSMEIWPNPASGVLSVKCLGLSAGSSCLLAVVDIFGRPAPIPGPSPILVKGETIELDISSLPPGIYFISVLDDGKRIAGGKFVVAR
jgi:hypothetical protein